MRIFKQPSTFASIQPDHTAWNTVSHSALRLTFHFQKVELATRNISHDDYLTHFSHDYL